MSQNNQRRPFEQIDLRGSDLEVGTLARLDHQPDAFGVDKFLRTKEQRINDPQQ
jgi:hypothetical protein